MFFFVVYKDGKPNYENESIEGKIIKKIHYVTKF